MDLNIARFNMVEQQVRPWDVLDPTILELLAAVPREQFVPLKYQQLAFSDTSIPIGFGQVILPPKFIGRLLQALQLDNQETVLEIGTGSGYLTSLLSKLAKKVISLDIFPEFSQQAIKHLRALGIHNAVLEVGDGINGWPAFAPYDAIVLTGSVPYLPKILREQVSIDGRLFAVVGESSVKSAVLLTRVGKERWIEQVLFETDIPTLPNAPKSDRFQF